MQTGAALISDIDSCNLQEGEIAFWWMGEFGYIVKIAGDCSWPSSLRSRGR